MWIKNTRGKPDALLTFSVVSVVSVLAKLLLAGVTLPNDFAFGSLDSSLAGVVLGATLGAYTTKRVVGGKADAS